ncbi:N-acetyltransferase family protein [Demequina sp.]|uniref:GNAT family N-acetyltransferase n=1 Tax=Demequina sp. TaxID=2050685 RepID=UPI003D0CFF2C
MLRDAAPIADAERVRQIYNHYVETNTATFEVEPIGEAVMANRIAAVQAADLPFLIFEDADGVQGFAYAAPFHERAAYVHTVTCSVYVDPGAVGRGVGKVLYADLIRAVRELDAGPHAPVRSIVALIALPNDASVALHEAVGFRHTGTIVDVGRKFGRWLDVGYWQLPLAH